MIAWVREKCYLCTPIIIKRSDVESYGLSSQEAARPPLISKERPFSQAVARETSTAGYNSILISY